MQTGWSDRYRLHETADGWLCVALVTDDHVADFDRRHRGRPVGAHRATSGSTRSTPPACRARSRTPTSCCRCSTTRR